MATSQKFRNLRRSGRAALVVDDIASASPSRVRFLEIRGTGEAIPDPSGPAGLTDKALIRIHPTQLRHRRASARTALDQAHRPRPCVNREEPQEPAPRSGTTEPSPIGGSVDLNYSRRCRLRRQHGLKIYESVPYR